MRFLELGRVLTKAINNKTLSIKDTRDKNLAKYRAVEKKWTAVKFCLNVHISDIVTDRISCELQFVSHVKIHL